jgi:hypothetical protein
MAELALQHKSKSQTSVDEYLELPFREKQLIENLSVTAENSKYQVLFYQMLN